MINHVWSVLCRLSSIDRETNAVSLFSAVEGLVTAGEPTPERPALLEAELLSLWYRESANAPTSGKMRVSYTDPNGHVSTAIELDISLTKSNFHRTRLNIQGLPIVSSGVYKFIVEYQVETSDVWEPAATLPVHVAVEPVPQAQT